MCLLLCTDRGMPVPQIMPVRGGGTACAVLLTGAVLGLGCCCPLLYHGRCLWFYRAENCACTAVAML